MVIKHPLGLEVVPCPHTLRTEKQLRKSIFIKCSFIFLFQNPSELSDEELNDDLLQSDDEDINTRYTNYINASY